eukprot:2927658-Pyramimonas_sp.AAC.1
MDPDIVLPRLNSLHGVGVHTGARTCHVATPGTVRDDFGIAASLVTWQQGMHVMEGASTFPHLPVQLSLRYTCHRRWARVPRQPQRLPPIPKPGRARFPPWKARQLARGLVAAARAPEDLAVAWDTTIQCPEGELLDRQDTVNHKVRANTHQFYGTSTLGVEVGQARAAASSAQVAGLQDSWALV